MCGNSLKIYSGNDDQILPILSLGGIGVISVLSNIKPKIVHNMCYEFFNKNFNNALDLQLKNLPLINALFEEVNPIPIKYALEKNGFNYGPPREPLTKITPKLAKKIDLLLN